MTTDIARSCASKKRYGGEEVAWAVVRKVWAERGVELRVYQCPACGGYHVTRSGAPLMMRPGWRPPAPSRREIARERQRERRRRR